MMFIFYRQQRFYVYTFQDFKLTLDTSELLVQPVNFHVVLLQRTLNKFCHLVHVLLQLGIASISHVLIDDFNYFFLVYEVGF